MSENIKSQVLDLKTLPIFSPLKISVKEISEANLNCLTRHNAVNIFGSCKLALIFSGRRKM